jgi:rhamnogalacturonan endolyase
MKPTYMHPSDSRLLSWKPTNFIIGTTATSEFSGYMWKDINNDYLVYFRLSSSQIAQSFKIRVGVTEGMAGGRPTIAVNGWTAALQGDKGQADTWSLTVGTYRGNNYIYEFTVPASAWLQSARDWQIIKVSVIIGKVVTGYLILGVSFDALDMVNV